MKKTATITINDKVITVNEITVRQMLSIKDSVSSGSILDSIQNFLPLLTDATPDFMLELAPSELKSLYNTVKEVNSDFFDFLPIEQMLSGIKENLTEIMMNSFARLSTASLPQGTEPQPMITDGDGSGNVSMQPEKRKTKR